jgi:uncharacterized protein (DUF1501 family)
MTMHRSMPWVSRRRFIKGAGALVASTALPSVLFAKTGERRQLVVVILRGALDGLAAVPPHADPNYALMHRDLAIGPPGAADGALALDATFGLHPALEFLHERYAEGELIVFHAAASPYRDRSHFDGQNVLENGFRQPLGSADGWLNRAIASLPLHAVAIAQNVPLILRGGTPVLSKSPIATPDVDGELLARLSDLYSKDDWFSARLSEAVQSERLGDAASDSESPPMMKSSAKQVDRVTASARMAAAVMKSEGGPEVAVLEATGWDTHANQGGAKGILSQRLRGLDGALRGLADDLGTLWGQTAVLVVTEFGRTAAMNGTRGTDHGTGGCAFLLGGAVRGGRVIADWPGLTGASLLDNRDLRPTLDLRSVFKGVLNEHLHIDAKTLAIRVFPDSTQARALDGLIRA